MGAAYRGLEKWDEESNAYETGWSCEPVGIGATVEREGCLGQQCSMATCHRIQATALLAWVSTAQSLCASCRVQLMVMWLICMATATPSGLKHAPNNVHIIWALHIAKDPRNRCVHGLSCRQESKSTHYTHIQSDWIYRRFDKGH